MNSHRMNRRRILASVAIGAGIIATGGTAAVAASSSETQGNAQGLLEGQWVSWDDGYLYPLETVDHRGDWIITDDESDEAATRYAVRAEGWVNDSQVWYRINEIDAEGVWYDGDDSFLYLLAF